MLPPAWRLPVCARILLAGLLAAILEVAPARAAAPLPPTHLRVNDTVNPVGTDAAPHFGWFVEDPDPNEIQTQYQILVSSSEANLRAGAGDVWDSGAVSSRQQNHVPYGGQPLAGDRQYFWQVRTWDQDTNAGPYSLSSRFVVGPLSLGDWSGAAWIKGTNAAADDYTWFRQTVSVPNRAVERATVYVSSVHKYAFYLNGTLVGKGPAYHYPQYQYYNGYDVTRLIQPNASNVFAVFNHWFGGGQGRPASARGVILKAVIHYADGTRSVVGTDGSWRQSRATCWITGQPHRNPGEGVGYVERIDARQLATNWNTLSFDDSSWTPAIEIGRPRVQPWTNALAPDLTRITETEITPASVTDKGGGKYLVDLGKVHSGMPRIMFSGGEPGTVVTLLGGYALGADGEVDTARNQRTDLRYFAVLDGGTFTFEPAEYLGLRYFQISNSPMPVTAANFKFVARHNAMSATASAFESPDATLNAVWDLMKHSLFVCAQESFVDTPTREKGGFLGDSAIQSLVAMPVTAERRLTRRALQEFLQSMDQYWSADTNRGRVNAVYPNHDGARDIPDFTQAFLVWAWEYYLETGDRPFLAGQYAKFKAVADYADRFRDPGTGLITNLFGGSGGYAFGIVDWPAAMRFGYDMTAARTVINCWAWADCDIVSRMAAELGHAADAEKYRARAGALQSAINVRLLNPNGVYVDGLNSAGEPSAHVSQHANLFPLALGFVPPDRRASVRDKVKELRMSVGMVTVMWLVRALGEADEGEPLIDLYTNAGQPGWARCLSRGATATWESWDADEDGQSESHAWGAAGLDGYVRYILGVKPLRPQYEVVQIKPLSFGAKLASAKGTLPTDRGDISVEWQRTGDRFVLKVILPANVTATVCVPKGAAADSLVQVDGAPLTATAAGNYLSLAGVGSGAHTFVRRFSPP